MKKKYLKYLYIVIAAKLLLFSIKLLTFFFLENLQLLQSQHIDLFFYTISGLSSLVSIILIVMVWVDRKTIFTAITTPALILFSVAILYTFAIGIALLIVANIVGHKYANQVTALNLSQHLIDD